MLRYTLLNIYYTEVLNVRTAYSIEYTLLFFALNMHAVQYCMHSIQY